MTFTCAIGKFVFNKKIGLGKAKLIRDTVQGQKLIPSDGQLLRDETDCLEFARIQFKDSGGHLLERVILA
jgi:hypothetical protein